jgi:hypothetical protein
MDRQIAYPFLYKKYNIRKEQNMAKRKREVVVRFHVTEQERSLIDEKMAMAGIRNRESYLRKMSLGGYVLKIDLTGVKEMTRLLANVTNNMNQIAKRANETRSIYESDIKDLKANYDSLWEQADAILRSLANLHK